MLRPDLGRTVSAACLIFVALAGAFPSAASAQCGLLGLLGGCPPAEQPQDDPLPSGSDPGGVEQPDQAVPPPGKRFGFNTALYWQANNQDIVDFEVGNAAQAGANVQRLSIHWSPFQPTASSPPLSPGSGLTQLDRLYATTRRNGIGLLLVLIDAPQWASRFADCRRQSLILGLLPVNEYPPGCEPVRDGKQLYPSREHLPALERFVTALGQRYPGVMFEVWNEPNLSRGAEVPSAWQMGEITCAVDRTAKALPERNIVLSPGFGTFNNGSHATAEESTRAYLDEFYSSAGGCYDGFSMHTYNGDWPDFGADTPFAEDFRIFRDVRSAHGDRTPIWVTEFGFTTSGPDAQDGGVAVDEEEQLDLLRRQYNRLASMPDVQAVITHTLRDRPQRSGPPADPSSPEYGYGWLRADGTRKPAWCAFAARSGRGGC